MDSMNLSTRLPSNLPSMQKEECLLIISDRCSYIIGGGGYRDCIRWYPPSIWFLQLFGIALEMLSFHADGKNDGTLLWSEERRGGDPGRDDSHHARQGGESYGASRVAPGRVRGG